MINTSPCVLWEVCYLGLLQMGLKIVYHHGLLSWLYTTWYLSLESKSLYKLIMIANVPKSKHGREYGNSVIIKYLFNWLNLPFLHGGLKFVQRVFLNPTIVKDQNFKFHYDFTKQLSINSTQLHSSLHQHAKIKWTPLQKEIHA